MSLSLSLFLTDSTARGLEFEGHYEAGVYGLVAQVEGNPVFLLVF